MITGLVIILKHMQWYVTGGTKVTVEWIPADASGNSGRSTMLLLLSFDDHGKMIKIQHFCEASKRHSRS